MTSDGIRDVLARHVAANSVRGALSVVLERGALHVASAGELLDSRSVVRITSLTKPIVAAAALSLVERGRFLASTTPSKGIFRNSQIAES